MSLINEALKKAQRLRQEQEAAAKSGASPAGAHAESRHFPTRSQTFVLIAAGATTLIVLSVVATFYFIDREPSAKPPAVAPAKPPPAAVDTHPSPSPITIAPIAKPPPAAASTPENAPVTAPGKRPAPKPAATPPATTSSSATPTATSSGPSGVPVATEPSPKPAPPSPTPTTVSAVPVQPPPQPAQAAPATPQPDPRVQNFVDNVRVMGIRSSGADSKVLMNDRVYRLNEIVERTLGVRLVKVTPDTLTFADANGVTYTKSF